MQVLTIVCATVGSTYAFYLITERRMDRLEATVIRMDAIHHQDMKGIDEKWERLFERLLIQDKK